MLSCESPLQLTDVVSQSLKEILGITSFRLYFIDSEQHPTFTYFQESQKGTRSYQQLSFLGYKGIAGYTAQFKTASIITNIKHDVNYDSSVDIYTLLPLYALPILSSEYYSFIFLIIFYYF